MTVSAGDAVPPWQHLNGLDAYEITQIPRSAPDPPVAAGPGGNGQAPAGYAARQLRAQSLAPASRRGPFVFSWIRAAEGGDVRMITAGAGMRAGRKEPGDSGLVPLSYPAGAMGRPLGRGGAAGALAAVPVFVPVWVTADALLNLIPDGQVPSGIGPSLEDGFLRVWRDPFALVIIASPVSPERHQQLLDTIALDQLKAQRQDTPKAQLAEKRRRARHEEFRQARSTGLWEIWLLAGAESAGAAAEAAALLAASLDLRGLGFGLSERQDLAGPLPDLLGAPPEITDGRERGPVTRDILEMFGSDPRALRPRTTPQAPDAPAVSRGRQEMVQDSPSWSPPGGGGSAAVRARREEAEAAGQAWRAAGTSGIPGATAQHPSQLPGHQSPPSAGFPGVPPGGNGWEPAAFSMPLPPGVTANGVPAGTSHEPGYAPGYGASPGPTALPPGPRAGAGSASPPGTGAAVGWLGVEGAPPLSAAAMQPDFSDPVPECPVTAGSDLLAALAPVPAREIPGIRLVLQAGFDVTPETDPGAEGAVTLGTVLDGSRLPAGPFAVTLDSLNRHLFVCGATGSGKSQTVRNILEALTAKGIPWLVIEPAKAEYRRMAARIAHEVIVIRPGDPDSVAAGINPLEPALGPGGNRYPLQVHADLVRGLFLAAFQAEEPFPQVLSQALERVYLEAGWDMVSGEPAVEGASYPDLAGLQAAAMKVVDEVGYGREVRDNIRGFVAVRVGSLQSGNRPVPVRPVPGRLREAPGLERRPRGRGRRR